MFEVMSKSQMPDSIPKAEYSAEFPFHIQPPIHLDKVEYHNP